MTDKSKACSKLDPSLNFLLPKDLGPGRTFRVFMVLARRIEQLERELATKAARKSHG
jgi:hypothetical protein